MFYLPIWQGGSTLFRGNSRGALPDWQADAVLPASMKFNNH